MVHATTAPLLGYKIREMLDEYDHHHYYKLWSYYGRESIA